MLSLSHPELIKAAYRALLNAGADAIVTNTHGATALVMEDYGAAGKVSGTLVERFGTLVSLAQRRGWNRITPGEGRWNR